MANPHDPNADVLGALERFVVDNDDLLALESQLSRFNIFDALRIARIEIRHSNFLAFLLDPSESHGLGSLFLRAVLMDLLRGSPVELRPLSPIKLDGSELRGVEIKREWMHIDLLMSCNEPEFVVVVENKVDSGEHSNQLKRYREVIDQHFRGVSALFVYLTPDGDEASDDTWVPYSYKQIHDVFVRVRDTHHNAIGDEVLVFLNHYLNLLRTRFMDDEELDKLCQTIYKNHLQALDIIWERAGTAQSKALEAVSNIVDQDGRWEIIKRTSKYINLFPAKWKTWLPTYDGHHQFHVHVRQGGKKLVTAPFIGRMKDDAFRDKVVIELRKKSPALGFKTTKASSVSGTMNRVAGRETLITWKDEEEIEDGKFLKSISGKLEKFYLRVEKLGEILKELCIASQD